MFYYHNLFDKIITNMHPLFTTIIKNPFKAYLYGSSFCFGTTLVTNSTSLITGHSRVDFVNHPQITMCILVLKSVYFSIVWPIIPYTLIRKPHEYLVLGGSYEENYTQNSKI